jgi:hypothetical protein
MTCLVVGLRREPEWREHDGEANPPRHFLIVMHMMGAKKTILKRNENSHGRDLGSWQNGCREAKEIETGVILCH